MRLLRSLTLPRNDILRSHRALCGVAEAISALLEIASSLTLLVNDICHCERSEAI